MKKNILILLLAFILYQLPCQAEIVDITNGGNAFTNNAASLNNVTNATVTVENVQTCNVNVTSGVDGAVLNWTKLSVPKNNTLNFNFSGNDQYALNKVTSGISEFSGSVNSNGGTVIFSNPNGIVCNDGATFNVGSLILSTHDVNFDSDTNTFKFTKMGDLANSVEIQQGANIQFDGNVTITSVGDIDLQQADITAKDFAIVTANGLNYALLNRNITDIQTSAAINENAINIANTAIKTTDGKIVLTSAKADANINISNTKFNGVAEINSEAKVNVKSASTVSNQTKGGFFNDATINAKGDVEISSVSSATILPFRGNLTVKTLGNIVVKNARIVKNYKQTLTLEGKDVTFQNYSLADNYWNWNNALISKLNVVAENIIIDGVQVQGDSVLTATKEILTRGALFGRPTVDTIATWTAPSIVISDYENQYTGLYPEILSELHATATGSITLNNGYMYENCTRDAFLTTPTLVMNKFAFKNMTVNNLSKLTTTGSKIFNDVVINAVSQSAAKQIASNIKNMEVGGKITITAPIPQGIPSEIINVANANATLNTAETSNLNALNTNATTINSPLFIKAFAAAEENDNSDYKEEFLTRYVKEDKDGTLYTINTFAAK